MSLKTIIITQRIEPYRFKFYELLSSKLNHKLTGIHSNQIKPRLGFNSKLVVKRTFLGFHFQTGFWRKYIFSKQTDLVISEFDLHVISNILILFVCKILKIKFIWWGIGLGNNQGLYGLRKLLIKLSNGIIVYEESSKNKLIKIGIDESVISVMKNTVYVLAPAFNSDLTRKKSILVVGKLDKRKGIDKLLQSFSEVHQKLEHLNEITIIGDGPEKENLVKLVTDLQIDKKVIFKGKILDEELLKEEFHKSIATIHPYQAGLSILHSFAYGVPFITSNNSISGGELVNIQHGINGVLYQDNTQTLTSIILDIDKNPEKYNRMGLNAYNYYINDRTIELMADNYYNAIIKLSNQ